MATATATRRKLVLKMSVSLDGFVAGPNDEVDWIFRTLGDDSMEWVTNTHREAGAHAMGARTYYDMAAFRPFANSPLPQAMNDIPKVILSRKGIKDGTQLDQTTEALADARADDIGARQGVTPTAAVLQS
jgi:dihydrofolate reductase